MIDWSKLTIEDYEAVDKVIERVKEKDKDIPMFSLSMDIQAAHIFCPMDWEKLLNASNFDFWHDISGIYKNLNRRTGKLENCFIPRCAK